MKIKRNPLVLAELSACIAEGGQTLAQFAEKRQLSPRTVQSWAGLPEVQDQVRAIRQGMVDRAVGQLSSLAAASVTSIARLASKAESEAVRLAALKTLLTELVNVASYADLAAEIAQLRDEVANLKETRRARR